MNYLGLTIKDSNCKTRKKPSVFLADIQCVLIYSASPAYNNNTMCHCGKKGCIETEVAGRTICRKITERIKNGEMSLLSKKVKDRQTIIVNDVIDAAEKEDPWQ